MPTGKLLLLLLFSLILVACSNPYEEQKVLFDEVMEVHDEVMPKMSNVYDLKQQLNARLTQLNADSSGLDTTRFVQLISQKRALEEADNAMMTWMRDFADKMAPPGEEKYESYLQKKDMSHEAYMAFLEAEKTRIVAVKEKMLQSIDDAEKSLKE